MICQCLPEWVLVEFEGTGLGDSVTAALGGSYSATNAGNLPAVNPAFFIYPNENGVDTLYMLKNTNSAAAITFAGAAKVGKVTAWSEILFCRLFGGRPPAHTPK